MSLALLLKVAGVEHLDDTLFGICVHIHVNVGP